MVAEQKSPTLDGRQVASGKSLIELEALAVGAAVWDPIGLSAFFNCISSQSKETHHERPSDDPYSHTHSWIHRTCSQKSVCL
jgi:hypothetical protein